jgi:dihydrofolate synthase / folylpolyglutamate synthase
MTYLLAQAALHQWTVRAVQPGLKRTGLLLKGLKHPENTFPIIQITGSNGKGSVAAMLSAVLMQAGFRVGRFTSPHLKDERERISIQEKIITRSAFARAVEKLLPGLRTLKRKKDPATTFEAWTVLAAEAFRHARVDIAVVEVGMGGRLDATTVWGNNVLSLLTNVQLEHTAQLGNSKLAICREKLGIAISGIPLLSAESDRKVRKFIQTQGKQRGFPVYFAGSFSHDAMRMLSWKKNGQGFTFYCESALQKYGPIQLPLSGSFQLDNAVLALLALEKLQERSWAIIPEAIKKGFLSVRWPGRMEQVAKNPQIFLDGAHNPAAIKAATQEWRTSRKKVIVIAGMMGDKDVPKMCGELLPIAKEIITVTPPDKRAISAQKLADRIAKIGKKALFSTDYIQAIQLAQLQSKGRLPILIIGSLYNIDPAKEALKKLRLGI